MARGAKKGERRGGRMKGTRNKLVQARVARLERQGRVLPPEEMLLAADRALFMLERYQPVGPDGEENPEFNEERYAEWHGRWLNALKDAAPYYAPRLMAMAIQPISKVDEDERADSRQVMWEIYNQMRERGQIRLKELAPLVLPPAVKANGSEPVTIEAKAEEGDDGDGVADD